jgi:hypothetical protein
MISQFVFVELLTKLDFFRFGLGRFGSLQVRIEYFSQFFIVARCITEKFVLVLAKNINKRLVLE